MEVAKHMEEMIIGTSLAGLLTLGAVGTFAMFFLAHNNNNFNVKGRKIDLFYIVKARKPTHL